MLTLRVRSGVLAGRVKKEMESLLKRAFPAPKVHSVARAGLELVIFFAQTHPQVLWLQSYTRMPDLRRLFMVSRT